MSIIYFSKYSQCTKASHNKKEIWSIIDNVKESVFTKGKKVKEGLLNRDKGNITHQLLIMENWNFGGTKIKAEIWKSSH